MKKAIEWNAEDPDCCRRIFPLHLPSYSCIPDALSLHWHRSNLDCRTILVYSFIWLYLWATGAMVYEKRHFAFTSVSDMLKNEKIKSVLAIIISLVMLVFAVLMAYYGYKLTQKFWNYTWTNIPSFKRGPTWTCLPICGVTSTIYLIAQIIEEIGALMKGGNK